MGLRSRRLGPIRSSPQSGYRREVTTAAQRANSGEVTESNKIRPRLTLAVAVLSMAALPLSVTGANLAFPAITKHFETASLSTLSWALSGYSIVLAALTLLGGQLTDRLGAYPIFITGLVIFTAMGFAAGAAPSAALFVSTRALQGVGGALIVPSSLGLILSRWPAERHRFAIGVWTAAFPIGSSVAPVAASLLLNWKGWRSVFLGFAIVAALGLIAALALGNGGIARRSAEAITGLPDMLGIAIGTVAVGLAALGISKGSTWGWGSASTIASLALAIALVPLFIRRSRQHPRPLVSLDLFSIRTFRVANLANVPVSAAGMAAWLVWPLFFVNAWQYKQLRVGLAMVPTPIIVGIGSFVVAKWAQRHGFRSILLVGSFALVAACAVLATAPGPDPSYWRAMFPGLLLYGVAMGMLFAPLNGAALVDIPPAQVGQANATFATGRFLSGGLGIAATVAVLGSSGGKISETADPMAVFTRAYVLLGALGLASLIMIAISWPRDGRTNYEAS